jgi:hypothetical protein
MPERLVTIHKSTHKSTPDPADTADDERDFDRPVFRQLWYRQYGRRFADLALRLRHLEVPNTILQTGSITHGWSNQLSSRHLRFRRYISYGRLFAHK